jgi:hypothetical protein
MMIRVRHAEEARGSNGGARVKSAGHTTGTRALYVTALLAAAAVVLAADIPHMAVERKLVVSVLSPALLVFLTSRADASVIFCLCANCYVVGFLSHLLLHKFV